MKRTRSYRGRNVACPGFGRQPSGHLTCPSVRSFRHTSTTTYCGLLRTIHTNDILIRDKSLLLGINSALPDVANKLFTFMAQRYVAIYEILGCAALLGKPVNVTLTANAAAVVIDAQVSAP